MKRILLTGSPFTWNYGSMALVISAIDRINEEYPNTIFFKGSIDLEVDKKNYSIYFKENKLKLFGFNFGKKHMFFFVPLLTIRSIPYIMKSDIVLEVSGEIPDDMSVFSLLLRAITTKMLKKPFIIYAMGFGPYKHKITIPFLKLCLFLSDMVIVRESETYDYLKKMNISKKIHLTADHAFLFRPLSSKDSLQHCKRLKIENISPFIIIAPKNNYQKWPEYLEGLRTTIKYILKNFQMNILILPHGNEDIQVSQKLYSYFKRNHKVKLVDEIQLPEIIKGLMQFSEFVVSSRVHGGIASISQNVPAIFLIPLDDHRGIGILGKSYNLMDFIIDPRNSANIINPMSTYFSNKNRILKQIKDGNKIVFSQSEKNVKLISRFLN